MDSSDIHCCCQCCGKQPATRKCYTCDPSSVDALYMCSTCDSRAHFGPMKLSHITKSLANMALVGKVSDAYDQWAAGRKQSVAECMQEMKNWTNDIDAQKHVDLEVMNAVFDPIKNAVVSRKRELTAQITAHYEKKKAAMTEVTMKCQHDINSVDLMAPLDLSTLITSIPGLVGEQRAVFPTSMNLEAVVKDIQGCELQPSKVDTSLMNSLTLLSGDIGQVVVSSPMDSDGIFWAKRIVPPESYSSLCQLGYHCRRKVILQECTRYSEHPQDLYTGLVVMVNVPGEEIWKRAVIVDPCVKDKPDKSGNFMTTVVYLDSGHKQNVYQSRLTECPQEFRAMPFLAVPCSLYPQEHEPLGVEPRWLFNDLVKEENNRPRVFNAKFVHKKGDSPSQTPVWYVELIDPRNPSSTLNAKFEEKCAEKSIAKGVIMVEDIRVAAGLVPPSPVVWCSTSSAPTCTNLSEKQEAPPTPTQEAPPIPTQEAPPTPTQDAPPTPTQQAPPIPTQEAPPTPTQQAPPTQEAPPTSTQQAPPTQEVPLTPTQEVPSSQEVHSTQEAPATDVSTSQTDISGEQELSSSHHSQSTLPTTDQSQSDQGAGPVGGRGDNQLTNTTADQAADVITHNGAAASSEQKNPLIESCSSAHVSSSDGASQRLQDVDHTPPHDEKPSSRSSTCGKESPTGSTSSVSGSGSSEKSKTLIRNWLKSSGKDQNHLLPVTAVFAEEFVPAAHRGPVVSCKSSAEADKDFPQSPTAVNDDKLPDMSAGDVGAEKEMDPAQSYDGLQVFSEESTAQQPAVSRHWQTCYNCGVHGHVARDCTLRPCVVCKGPHSTYFCDQAKVVYNRGGCPYCLSDSHSMNEAYLRCKPPQRLTFNFINRKSKKPSHGKKNYGRRGNY